MELKLIKSQTHLLERNINNKLDHVKSKQTNSTEIIVKSSAFTRTACNCTSLASIIRKIHAPYHHPLSKTSISWCITCVDQTFSGCSSFWWDALRLFVSRHISSRYDGGSKLTCGLVSVRLDQGDGPLLGRKHRRARRAVGGSNKVGGPSGQALGSPCRKRWGRSSRA